ncbi:CAMK/CAMKL/KIN1 protein kinase [Coniosporium apollinis CBS 100218]|uniref:non-specific serine/threonine protein kinase n=1 Tax=Coniosporium apollinis (strain CBS 100218) TaxID=1168221 RepID=R7Z016_CONA1|nr:CAMK/CAMKL/KIN1 protein kinase [Coniosporium apollinis CBS 100218]EON67428.1 CAMK/CAMKL/KIN1 protein kinase [Coniosporium apollinis CBS 100218]
MSTTAPTSPAVVRTPSSRQQQTFSSPVDRPHRTQSTASRSAAQPPASPHRSLSQSQQARGSSTSQQRGDLINVARRDFEQSNVAQPPASRRSSSRDPPVAPTPTRADSMRSHHRNTSRSGPPRYAEAVAAAPANINGVAAESGKRPATGTSGSQQGRRRTTIDATTGQWHLGKTIGAGSMGKVKLARNLETGEQVAVKIVPRQSTDEHRSEQDRQRADHSKEVRTAREAAIVSLVNHPYICGMRDFVRTNYHWYMLFEYVNGGQMLDYIISHGRLKEKQARKFGRQIASALDYCHRNSIVHRDLKIENILISKTGDIKIIDFGLSNLFAPKSYLKTFCGSLYFAAPELLQAKQYTGPEVDVWSFGIVLYVLVCGKVPFDDQSMPQLHAKIKKGVVDYPPWLSAECKNLISRMLVTDPRQRATLSEIMSHPWITKGFNVPPENYLPAREPLRLPLDPKVIEGMHGFDFGTPDYIAAKLTELLTSEEYQHAVRALARKNQAQTPETDRKRGVFDFYKRRNSTTSRDTLTGPSAEAVQLGADPVNAYHPLISVYYLVREKQERERIEPNPGALALPKTAPNEKPFKLPDLQAPAAAYTNASAYEMPGERPTGGRSRPRARTHGEDEIVEGVQRLKIDAAGGPVSPALVTPPSEQTPAKKESAAAGLLRRFSTRRHKDPERERASNLTPPALAVSGPGDGAGTAAAPPRKSFSVRRTRERSVPPSTNLQPEEVPQNESGLLSPPGAGASAARKLKGLGRSASVNSAELRRRISRRGTSEGSPRPPPPTSGSDRSDTRDELFRPDEAVSDDQQGSTRSRGPTSRAKSLGHARRESIQARRARREQAKELGVPEETDQELATEAEAGETTSPENMKPVFLKGLFSVSTTSNKPLTFIRQDIIRVLRQLGVEYSEIKGGFNCRHSPSIDLNKVTEIPPASPGQPPSSGNHRRKISFGGFMGGDREREELREQSRNQSTPRTQRHRQTPERSYTNSEESDESVGQENIRRNEGRSRAPGETTTHVQSDLGGNMVLKFEIFIVKVPLLSLHGIQFKKVDGGTWQYKNMAQKILDELRL